MQFHIDTFFDPATFSLTYLIHDLKTRQAAVIDPVLDFYQESGTVSEDHLDKLLNTIKQKNLKLKWILETHAHADHLTAAHRLHIKTGASIVIGENIAKVQKVFAEIFELDENSVKPECFDRLVSDGDCLPLGDCEIKVLHTPGHTPSCCTYLIGDAAFVGDTLFMPDYGTARCDFPGGDARQLYQSIQKILSLPDNTRLFMCHDYMPNGREMQWQTTVADQKANNIHINQDVNEKEFVNMREERDKTLSMPKLILPALQVNIRAGELPETSEKGSIFLKIPLNKF
ncbi:MAG: MBL fold metallo-hydrolase [Gammaproteobacteria bacterium]|nr:MBL fold metallo-hydrolase [Gammaproteobacteria bacterium]MDH5628863.1 MBL fold metallo-hydrolase [Gammaproteobacteria bacterium]